MGRMTALIHTLFPPETVPAKIKGEVRFVTAHERSQSHGSLGLLLTVCVSPPPWPDAGGQLRGRLRDAIESAIESALELNDAPPPGVGDFADLDQCLSDQLYRARSVGAGGLVLCMPDLTSAGSLAGALDAEDSAVLRWWMAATAERPVMLLLDEANRHLGAYGPPTRLEHLVEARSEAHRGPVRQNVTRHPERIEAAPEPCRDTANRPPSASHVELSGLRGGNAVEHGLTSIEAEAVHEACKSVDMDDGAAEFAHDRATLPSAGCAHDELGVGAAVEPSPHATASPPADRVVPLFPGRESPFRKPGSPGGFPVGVPVDWRGFANDLALARGPKPLSFVERLFMTRYVPLLDAIARGEADETARRTADQWADDFARSYTEGFSALRVTGKRPRMVLDAPQLASQVARLHGAKSTHLVLVDAMRFDLGMRVHDRMCDALMSQATCTERLLLWAALPTTTPVQLDLIAHGPEGLANLPTPSEQEEPGLRGRASPMLRRIKLGGRDVLKLDLVQARLHEAGPPLPDRLDALADEVAAVIAAHARNLPPRSLMLVFGDHGFRMESVGSGTSAGSAGGAYPEEVLVPGFAWLIGDVH
ncbi:MAG TPA: hypothetical protein VK550_04335 [Polyangiaceae bacterium]|nr:hypothetical protein [Polyangiaceae bacterium]